MKVCSACRRCYEDDILSCSEDNHDILTDARAGSTEVIPNYRLEVLRESDAASETYRAVNTILHKPYLIKIVAPAAFDETTKKLFLAEAKALSAIIHPNVARVFESGTLPDGSLYAVTEYFEAQTLRECFENVGKPSEVTTLTILRQAAEGLEALHAAGVLHRSIKPENIILTSDAENKFLIKLQNMDFGALRQRLVNAAGDLFLTDLRYFSPEQCAAGETDAQTDVYALGVVLYESLAGKVPFDAAYADALIIKQTKEQPPEVKIHSFDIRMLLTHTLTDALQKTTRARLKTANAMARRLRHIEQLATHSSTPPPAMAYPAAMNKTAVAFTPPARIAKNAEVEKLAEVETPFESVPAMVSTPIAEILPPVETPAIIQAVPEMEAAAIAEDAFPNERAAVAEDSAFSETAAVFEDQASFKKALTVENLPITAAAIDIEEIPAAAPALIVEDLPVLESRTVAETQPSIEISSIETQPAIEAPAFIEEIAPAETPSFVEEIPVVERRALVEEIAPTETQPAFETAPSFESEAAAEEFAESEAVAQDFAPARSEAAFENLSSAESEPAAEIAFVDESEPIIETANAAEIQADGDAVAPPAFAVVDYSTTKLPPIEKIISDPNFKVTEIETIFSLKRGNFDVPDESAEIHKTSEPVLIEWEQPDDVPTTTAALNISKKRSADVQFIANADVIEAKAADEVETRNVETREVETREVETDEAETDEVEYVSEAHKTRRDYASVSSVFASYEDSAAGSWNLPGKRAVMTGAAICGLMILAVGGVYLNRQMQSVDTQTTAKSSPANEKTLPKTIEPQPKTETSAPVKTENPVVSTVENADAPELPNYEPRQTTDVKSVSPVSPASSSSKKQRSVVKLPENPKNDKNAAQNKTETAVVYDKKGNVKPSPEKKNAAKNQASTPTKNDVFTRPRVVKNPKF